MTSRILPWKLYAVYLVVLAVFTVLVGTWILSAQRAFHRAAVEEELLRSAQLLAGALDGSDALTIENVDPRVKRWGQSAEIRLTVVAPSGVVLGDSLADPAGMENHADRPEIRAALRGEQGSDQRVSATQGVSTLYVAAPLKREGRVIAAARAALPLTRLKQQLAGQRMKLLAGGSVLVGLAAVLGWFVAVALGAPLEDIKRGAERFAAGDLSRRIDAHGTREVTALADSLNRMAMELDGRMKTIERQAAEREAILSSMSEGVIAVDEAGRVISLNDAAARLLSVNAADVLGRPLPEIVRNSALEELVAGVLQTGQAAEGEIVLQAGSERFLQVHCTVLHDSADRPHGAVAVVADLTRLRHLETVRREFVANVSHELKTPVTSIKGFIETLRDGAFRDPVRAERFLEIIARQSERLSMIIEDLLTLSRLEEEGGEPQIPMRSAGVAELLESAAQVCESKASERSIPVRIACDHGLQLRMNPPLLEQAIVNLVDNAIKNSDPGSPVQVEARVEGSEVLISVSDGGCGIEAEHLGRLFERFYRVDQARSRKAGGTGLGLSIVKHIAQAHGGSVSVTSVTRSEGGE